jgi:transcription termination/antitermination protein NusA
MPRSQTKKTDKTALQKQKVLASIQEFIQGRGIDRQRFVDVMKRAFLDVLELSEPKDKESNSVADTYSVIVDPEHGDFQLMRRRLIVEDAAVEDERFQVPLSYVLEMEGEDAAEPGEYHYEVIPLDHLSRLQVQALKERLLTQLRNLERQALYERYRHMIGEILTCEVLKVTRDELIVMHEGNELSLPRRELIPEKDVYVPRDSQATYRRADQRASSIVKAVVLEVLDPLKTSPQRPLVILSRTSPKFLEALLKLEIPEIYDGLISIKKVVRIPGVRAKVLVESYDDRIDPVGACVGVRGSRIKPIVDELRGEYIDIIPYNPDPKLMIERALAPATVMYVEVMPTQRHAKVFVAPEEFAKAVGKEGVNVRLAEMLLDYKLDIREAAEYLEEEDIELSEFADEIPDWIIKALQQEGFHTAKAVLQYPLDEMQKRTQIDLPILQKVYQILEAEFEE